MNITDQLDKWEERYQCSWCHHSLELIPLSQMPPLRKCPECNRWTLTSVIYHKGSIYVAGEEELLVYSEI